jgi:hypothetical protein
MKSRLGADPLERTLIRDTRGDKPAARTRPTKPAKGGAGEQEIKEAYARGKATNYYINKNGAVLQKILVYLPFDFVRQLKKEAIDERMSLSTLIQKRLSSWGR